MTTTDTTRHAGNCRFAMPQVPHAFGEYLRRAPDPECPRCAARLAAMGWPRYVAGVHEARYDAERGLGGNAAPEVLDQRTTPARRDPIAALDRDDVEAAILTLRSNAADGRRNPGWNAQLERVADALAETLIDRGDA